MNKFDNMATMLQKPIFSICHDINKECMMCQFLCGLFKKEKNHDAKMTMAKPPKVALYPITSEISPAIDIETHYALEEKVALAMAFSKRLDQSAGDGTQVFANVTRSDSSPQRP